MRKIFYNTFLSILLIVFCTSNSFGYEQVVEPKSDVSILKREMMEKQISFYEELVADLQQKLDSGVRIERNGSVFFEITGQTKSLLRKATYGAVALAGTSTAVFAGASGLFALPQPQKYLDYVLGEGRLNSAKFLDNTSQAAFIAAILSGVLVGISSSLYGLTYALDSTASNKIEMTPEEMAQAHNLLEDSQATLDKLKRALSEE